MCGFVVLKRRGSEPLADASLKRALSVGHDMLKTQVFRGPDEFDVVGFGPTVLGHARLSIIDLNTGSQPIYNEDRTVAVVLNGEIYNYKELRNRLVRNGHRFETESDTEVIVHLYEEVGEDVFSQLDGMFAIVIHDLRSNTLLAGRDRMGEKPLLYWETDDEIVLATELKAIIRHPLFTRNVNKEALYLYFHTMYVPAPTTIFDGVRKLPPATFLHVSDSGNRQVCYWTPPVDAEPLTDEKQIAEEFESIFRESIALRRLADVPIGVFLSGGIDSSAVAAFMANICDEPIKTYSARFGNSIDETPFADLVAKRYGTDHHVLNIEEDIVDVIQDVLTYFDEPFGDSSAMPTYMISRKAREHVKVVLTGDGGDELFAGYDAYIDQKHQYGGRVTTKGVGILNALTKGLAGWDFRKNLYAPVAGRWAVKHWMWIRTVFRDNELSDLLQNSDCSWGNFFAENQWLDLNRSDSLSRAFAHDINFYLPDDLLKKVDMASMYASLECRAPFLDHRLVEFSLRIPPQLKLKNDTLKYLLKRSLEPHLPSEILYRSKQGFGAPVEDWLLHQLRELTNDLLAPGCQSEEFLNRGAIQKALDAVYIKNCAGDYLAAPRVWLILVFEIWLRSYMPR